MGPILPFLPVYGKQLGVSPLIMGSITGILPFLFLIAKPAFGFLVDYFRTQRKLIFIILLAVTSGCYILMYFLPVLSGPMLPDHHFQNVSCASLLACDMEYVSFCFYVFIFILKYILYVIQNSLDILIFFQIITIFNSI